MLTFEELNLKLLSELRVLGEQNSIADAGKLSKKDLIKKILEIPAAPAALPTDDTSAAARGKRMRSKSTANEQPTAKPVEVPPVAPKPVAKVTPSPLSMEREHDGERRGKRQRIPKEVPPLNEPTLFDAPAPVQQPPKKQFPLTCSMKI
jgi:transcription termination factor Rho